MLGVGKALIFPIIIFYLKVVWGKCIGILDSSTRHGASLQTLRTSQPKFKTDSCWIQDCEGSRSR